jgi:hypothetical protein
MPTRRIFELVIVTSVLMRPAFGVAHLWAARIIGTTPEGSPLHAIAEVVTVLV